MAQHTDDGRAELEGVAISFRVHEELDQHLAEVYTNHRDPSARERLRDYLDSPRLVQGLRRTDLLSD